MTEGEYHAAGRGGRGLKIALAVSVALNLAAAGFLVGLAIGGPPREGRRAEGLGHYARALPEPFDAGRVSAALSEQRGAMCALAERGAGLLLEQIGRMSPEERRAYAAALERPRRRSDR